MSDALREEASLSLLEVCTSQLSRQGIGAPSSHLPIAAGVNHEGVRVKTDKAVKVNVKFNILHILEVDQIAETFNVIFTVHQHYVDPVLRDFRADVTYLDGNEVKCEQQCSILSSHKKTGRVKFKRSTGQEMELDPTQILHVSEPDWEGDRRLFRPVWSIGNVVGIAEELFHTRVLEYCSEAGGHVFEKIKMQATLIERLELETMPFDRQLLRIKIYGELPIWRMQLALWRDEVAGYPPWLKGNTPSEWLLDEEVVVGGKKLPAVRAYARKPMERSFRSELMISIHLTRDPRFYEWNVIAVNAALTMASAAAYAFPASSFEDRSSVLFTVMLTTVGYKLVTVGWLPVKSYLTVLDIYILVNFTFQFINIAECFVAAAFVCCEAGELCQAFKATAVHCPAYEVFEGVFAVSVYGVWAALHIVWIVLTRLGYGLQMLDSWEAAYKRNNMLAESELMNTFDQNPYGDLNM